MRSPHLCCFVLSVCAAGAARAASLDERVEALFRPLPVGRMALSPEGRRVAYSTREDGDLTIVILDLERPGAKRRVRVDPARDGTTLPAASATPLRFLQWATADRLVFAPAERTVPLPPLTTEDGRTLPNPDGPTIVAPIMVTEADGRRSGTLVDARDFLETPPDARRSLADLLRTPKQLADSRPEPLRWRMPHVDILGFVPGDREQLIIATHGAYNPPAQYAVDLRTGDYRAFGGNWPAPPGANQVFDWFRLKIVGERKVDPRPTTAWRDDELGRVQRELEAKFPRRGVELLDWSETRARVLFRVTGGGDPGRVFMYQRAEDLVLELFRRAPWLDAADINPTRSFSCAAPDGARLSGQLTWPSRPRRRPLPLLLVFPTTVTGPPELDFDPEAQVFADLGFVVVRLNHRSVAGRRTEGPAEPRGATDRMAVDDARAVLAWIASHHPDRPFDPGQVIALGRNFGGYLAVRALQLQPTAFCAAIAVDAPADWPVPSMPGQGADLTHPILLLSSPNLPPASAISTRTWREGLRTLGPSLETFELDAGFVAGQPAARAAAYRKIDEFCQRRLAEGAANSDGKRESR